MQPLTQLHQQQGMITLVISIMLLLIISIVTLMVAKSSTVEQKISANQFGAKQAATAAQAGIQFAIPYLIANHTTIIQDADNNGFIDSYSDSNTNNVSLIDGGGSYTITYSNPVANNFNLIQVQAIGTSANGNVTRTVRQMVYGYNNVLPHPGSVGLVSKSIVTLSGNVDVVNTVTNHTIEAGGLINSSGSVEMTTSSGSTNNPSDPVSGANMNNTTLQNATNEQLFQNFFGTTMAAMQARADLYYSSGGNFSSTLNGVVGKIIYISGSASFASNATIGSASQPVIIIADGTVDISGTVNFYGFIYSAQSVNISGSAIVRGIAAGSSNFNVSGNVDVVYDPTVVNNLSSQWKTFAPVAGSWRDF